MYKNYKDGPNRNYQNFKDFLNGGPVRLGTNKFDPPEVMFGSTSKGPKWLEDDYGIISAEMVHNTDDEESSMPVSVVWKITFRGGADYWSKTKFEEQTVYFDFYGYNRSHEGRTYEGWREVKPVTKTVEVFE